MWALLKWLAALWICRKKIKNKNLKETQGNIEAETQEIFHGNLKKILKEA